MCCCIEFYPKAHICLGAHPGTEAVQEQSLDGGPATQPLPPTPVCQGSCLMTSEPPAVGSEEAAGSGVWYWD